MALGPLAFYLTRDILAAFDPTAFRTGDSRYDILRRILIAVGGQCSCSADSEFTLVQKILIQVGGSCRCGDALWNLYSRLLIQFRLNAGLPDESQFAFRFGDNLINILQKIVNVLNASPVPVPPEPPFDACCPPPIGSYGFLTEPETVACDFRFVTEVVDCSADYGALV